MEQTGWHNKSADYDKYAGSVTCQTTSALLDAAKVTGAMSTLDIASGPGYGAGEAAARGADAIGLDFAYGMVAEATKNYPKARFLQGDGENLEFDDGSFEAVTCPYGLLHMPDPEKAVAEAYRVLKNGGHYAFSVWTTPDTHEFFDVILSAIKAHGDLEVPLPEAPPVFRFSDHDECRKILKGAGFGEIKVVEVNAVWKAESAQSLLDMIYNSTVRTSALLELQNPEARETIHAALLEGAEKYRDGDGFSFDWPSVIAAGRKA